MIKSKFIQLLLSAALCFFASDNCFAQYDGGSGSGSSYSCYSQSDNVALQVFSGGSSDGADVSCYTQADNVSFAIYAGGNNDGADVICYTQSDNISFA